MVHHSFRKRKAAGGYVHYILGNHEIMNMADERLCAERYIQHACCEQTYATLRTKRK